jgi:hypothetical protein
MNLVDKRLDKMAAHVTMSASRPLSPQQRRESGHSGTSHLVESRIGAVAWAIWQRSVSHPRSSNRTCRSPASGSPTGFIVGHTEKKLEPRAFRPTIQLSLKGPDRHRCCQAHRQSPSPHHLRKHTRSQGPLLCWHCPASTLLRPCPTPARTAACRDVEVATLARHGSPSITRTTFPTCRAHYPGGSSRCVRRLLPRSRGLPQMAGGSASALSLSGTAQASLALRPIGSLSRLKRPLSRGSSSAGHPTKPLVSFRINRQLSGWNLPPLMIRAFEAHCQQLTLDTPDLWVDALVECHQAV